MWTMGGDDFFLVISVSRVLGASSASLPWSSKHLLTLSQRSAECGIHHRETGGLTAVWRLQMGSHHLLSR